jgi:hypothetical protein
MFLGSDPHAAMVRDLSSSPRIPTISAVPLGKDGPTGAGDDAQHGAACVDHGALDHDPDHDRTDDRVHDHQHRQQNGLDGTAGSSRSPTPTSERPPGAIRSPTTSTGPSSRSFGTSARFWRARWRR